MMEPHNHGPSAQQAGMIAMVSKAEKEAQETRMRMHADALRKRVGDLSEMVQRRLDDLYLDLSRARKSTEEIAAGNNADAVNYHQPMFGSMAKHLDGLLKELARLNEQLVDTERLLAEGQRISEQVSAEVDALFPDGLPDAMPVNPQPVPAGDRNGMYL